MDRRQAPCFAFYEDDSQQEGQIAVKHDQQPGRIEWEEYDEGELGESQLEWQKQKDCINIDFPQPSVDANDPFGLKKSTIQSELNLKSKSNGTIANKMDALSKESAECKQSNDSYKPSTKIDYKQYFQFQDQKARLFPNLKRSKARQSSTVIDLEDQTTIFKQRVKNGSQSNASTLLNVDLIKREIKREQKLDLQRMKREKQQMKELFQVEPRRLKTQRMQKRKKVVSKRTLQLLAKKFDEYYAYEQNPEYKGPKVSLREIGQIFDIGPNTIHKLYMEWMDDPSFYDRIIHYDLNRRLPERKLTLERLQHVARLIKENPFLTQAQLCIQLNKIDDLKSYKDGQRMEINKTTIARLLRVGKFRKKRVRCIPKEKNTSKSLDKRYEYCTKYKELINRGAKIYFLDESGFNLYMARQKAWSRPKQQITVNCPISKGKRFSLIAIIGQEGLANWRIIEGTYRKYEYIQFLLEMFKKVNQLEEQRNREKWLIMDNCAIHDKEQTMKLASDWNMNVMYLPAYSPQLNPIEMWFHEVKTNIRKVNYSGERQLMEIMERELNKYQDHDFSAYYHGTMKFMEKGLRKQKF